MSCSHFQWDNRRGGRRRRVQTLSCKSLLWAVVWVWISLAAPHEYNQMAHAQVASDAPHASSNKTWAWWSPQPEPSVEQLYSWTPVWEGPSTRTLEPGKSLEIQPGRLSVLRVQFAEPRLASYVGLSRRFDAPPGSSAHMPVAPFRLQDGDWLVFSPAHQRTPLELTFSKEAPLALEFTVQRLEQAEPRYYWVWWANKLLAWIEAGGEGEPPPGLAIIGGRGVVQAAQLASLFEKAVVEAGGSDKEVRAARLLGRLRLLRAIEERREPVFGYYTSHDLLALHNDPLAKVEVRAGDRELGQAGLLDEKSTLEITVEGPAQVHLGLRAFKALARPDASTDYTLEVVEEGVVVHAGTFSSRAAKYDADSDEADPNETDPDETDPDGTEPDENDSNETDPPDDTGSESLVEELAADGRVFATDERGEVLGWRRQTRWWVPPGKHTYTIDVSGADVALDAQIFRPKQLVEDAVERRWDVNWHLEQVEDLLEVEQGSPSGVNRLLHIERAALVGEHRTLRRLIERYQEASSQVESPALQTWFAWQRLSVIEPDALADALPSAKAARQRAKDPKVVAVLRRGYAFALARLLLERGEPMRARKLVASFPSREDSVEQVLLRARAEMEGGSDRWQRWKAVSGLYQIWRERPTSAPVRKMLQRYWWSQTYWRDLEPSKTDTRAEQASVELAEAVPAESGEVFVEEVKDLSSVWYRVRPGKPYTFRTGSAFDRPGRLARVRLLLEGSVSEGSLLEGDAHANEASQQDNTPQLHRLQWNDQTLTTRRVDRRQTLTFAARPKTTHTLHIPAREPPEDGASKEKGASKENFSKEEASNEEASNEASNEASRRQARGEVAVFVDQPPLEALSLQGGDVVREHTYYSATSDSPRTFSLPAVGATRFVRIAVRGPVGESIGAEAGRLEDLLRCDFGDGRRQVVPVRWEPAPGEGAERAVRFVLEVPSSARQLTLRPRDASMLVALEMRAGKLPELPEDERIEVAVELPADQERLDAIRDLSNKIAQASTLERTELLIARAKILMSLATNRLAKVDLERAMELVPATHPLFEQARLLRRSVLARTSSKWFELEERWLADAASMEPLDLAAQVAASPKGDDDEAQIGWLRELLARWPDKRPDRRSTPWLIHRMLAERLLEQAARGGDTAAAAATDAYGHARRAAELFPVSSVRRVWYDALGHTRWTAFDSLTGGVRSAVATLEPTREVANADQFHLAVIDDPVEKSVEFALLGVHWPRSHAVQMYQKSTRSLAFEAQYDGELVLDRVCVDLRPDLQPSNVNDPCRLLGELHSDDGEAVAAEDSIGTIGSEQVVTTRWKVKKGVAYRLALERTDEVTGRLAYAYATVGPTGKDASSKPRPVVQRRARRVRVVAPAQPAATVLLGPTYLRLDARSLETVGADRVEVSVEHLDSGETREHVIELADEVQQGAYLSVAALGSAKLSRAKRAELWLSRAGPYRVVLEATGGAATLRLQARVHDATLERAGTGGASEEEAGEEQSDDDSSDENPAAEDRASEAGEHVFDLAFALEPVRAPHLARFGRRDLLEEQTLSATPFMSMGWSARDFELSSESPTASNAGSRLELLGGAYAALKEPALWMSAHGGLRFDFETPTVLTAGASADWRPDWWGLRIQPDLSVYTQTSGQAFFSSRTGLKVARSFGVAENLWWVHNVRARIRLQEDHADESADGPLSSRVYSSFAAAHPVTTDYLSLLWWRPFLNLVGYAYLQPELNPDFSLDKLRMRLVGRTLLQTTRVELGYAFTWYVDDSWREASFLRHDVELSSRLYYWVLGRQLLSVEAFGQGSVFDSHTYDSFEVSFGLSMSYTFASRTHTGQLPPTELTFEELIEPRYFRD